MMDSAFTPRWSGSGPWLLTSLPARSCKYLETCIFTHGGVGILFLCKRCHPLFSLHLSATLDTIDHPLPETLPSWLLWPTTLGFCSSPLATPLCRLHLGFVLDLPLLWLCFFCGCSHPLPWLQSQNVWDAPKFSPQSQLLSWVQIHVTNCPVACPTGAPTSLTPMWMLHDLLPLSHSLLLSGSQTIITPFYKALILDAPFTLTCTLSVSVSYCCYTKWPQTYELKQHKFIIWQV